MRQIKLEDLASYLNQMEGITNRQYYLMYIHVYTLF